MQKGRILIVDDNLHILESLKLLLKHDFQEVAGLSNPQQLSDTLRGRDFDLVLLDMNFAPGSSQGQEGLFWLKKIRQLQPSLQVVLMTAFGGVELAVRAMKEGAADFILKPWNPQKLVSDLKKLMKLADSEKKLDRYQSHLQQRQEDALGEYRCQSASMKALQESIARVGPTDANVLITGENGTGKEWVAREVHRLSHRSQEIFVSVDLGSIPETLFESELFGHLKGSFTGAIHEKKGRIEIANGGTLFLDELGNVSPAMQARLLSVLEKRQLIPLGGLRPQAVDIRLVSATNVNIREMVAKGSFREDLYYRLNTINLHIAPLRERPEDVAGFSRFFLQQFSRKYRRQGMSFSEKAIRKLCEHSWPGNVRELKHTIEKAVILAEGPVLEPADLFVRAATSSRAPEMSLQQMEKQAIAACLHRHQGNLSQAARTLGITRATLYSKMKKYGL